MHFNKLGLNENKLMSVNIDTGEVNEVDEYAIMPQLYRGSLIYAKDLITTPKIELVGTDFPLSWEQSDSRPTLSNVFADKPGR